MLNDIRWVMTAKHKPHVENFVRNVVKYYPEVLTMKLTDTKIKVFFKDTQHDIAVSWEFSKFNWNQKNVATYINLYNHLTTYEWHTTKQ